MTTTEYGIFNDEGCVRYVSPFGSPATMPLEEAETHLADDDELWLTLQAVGALSDAQHKIGPPRIEFPRG